MVYGAERNNTPLTLRNIVTVFHLHQTDKQIINLIHYNEISY